MSLENRVIFVPRGLRGSTGATGATGSPSVETARIDDLEDALSAGNTIWLDAVSGNDGNSGLASGAAVQTMGAAMALVIGGTQNTIKLLSDVTITTRFEIKKTCSIKFDSSGGTRSMTFQDDGTNVAGFWVRFGIVFGLMFLSVDIIIDTTKTIGAVAFADRLAQINSWVYNSTITQGGGNVGKLFRVDPAGGFIHGNLTTCIYSGAVGFLFNGVAAGADPTATKPKQYRSNIVSA